MVEGFALTPLAGLTGWHDYELVVGDYNGDGYTDVLLEPNVALSGGSGPATRL